MQNEDIQAATSSTGTIFHLITDLQARLGRLASSKYQVRDQEFHTRLYPFYSESKLLSEARSAASSIIMGCGVSRPRGFSRGRPRQSHPSGQTTTQSGHNSGRTQDGNQEDRVQLQSVEHGVPPTLASLGYECRESGREYDEDEPGRVQIKHVVTQPEEHNYIMTFGHNLNNGMRVPDHPEFGLDELTLFIEWIALDSDTRPKSRRPRAREVLVATWVHICNRPLMLLRRIYFQTVTESTTRQAVRDAVCPLMGIGWCQATNSPVRQFSLVQPGRSGTPGNDEAFERLCEMSKFVKIVASLPLEYPDMRQPGCPLTIATINIIPSYGRIGEQGAFDMEVVLEDGDASDTE